MIYKIYSPVNDGVYKAGEGPSIQVLEQRETSVRWGVQKFTNNRTKTGKLDENGTEDQSKSHRPKTGNVIDCAVVLRARAR